MDRTVPPFRFDPAKWPKPEWNRSDSSADRGLSPPLTFAYPENLLSAGRGSELPTIRADDAGNNKYLVVESGSERFTIDPERGYLTVRTESRYDGENGGKSVVSTYIVEESAQSPKGFWYPTRIRSSEHHDGKLAREDSILQFYLDFDAKMPESVFEPVDHVIMNADELK
jgi:hypothetical protein